MASKKGKRGSSNGAPVTLTIDIGGTGIKMMSLDGRARALTERAREETPQPATPSAVLAVCRRMLRGQPAFHRVAVGFPGVVQRGVVRTAPNLGTGEWRGFDLRRAIEELTGRPTRALNDAALQGYGVIAGKGVELVLTLGTGLGCGLYADGHAAPLELAHHPWKKGRTYEERVGNAARKKVGNARWNERVGEMIESLEPIFNYDTLWLGGGNTKKLEIALPPNVKLYDPEKGLAGGVRLWELHAD